jgi:tyrosyl-tRNA synthetase
MVDETTIKAYEVTELIADKLVKTCILPFLAQYKDTVFRILIEEETPESLEAIEKRLTEEYIPTSTH